MVLSILALAALGAAAIAWSAAAGEALGGTPAGAALLLALAGAGTAAGAGWTRARDTGRGPARGLAAALLGLGGLTLAAALLAEKAAPAMVWAGGATGSSPVAEAFARALVGAFLMIPAGLLAGRTLRGLAATLPEGRRGSIAAALGAAAAATLVLASTLIDFRVPAAEARGPAAAILILIAGVAWRFRGRSGKPSAPASGEPDAPRGAAPAAAAIAFAAAAWFFLGPRTVGPAVGPDLLGRPVPLALLAGGLALGAWLGAALRAWRGFPAHPALVGGALALVPVWALAGLHRHFAAWPAAFSELASETTAADPLAAAAARLFAPDLVPIGLALGLAVAWFAGTLPGSAERRAPWIRRAVAGATLGGVAGILGPRLLLPSQGIPATIVAAATVTAGLAVLAAVSRGPGLLRVAAPLLAIVLVGGAAGRLPAPDRDALLVEREVRADSSPIKGVQKNWKIFDRDGDVSTYAVLKRGHERRLLVDGRFEVAGIAAGKSHGMLAHLPLALHGGAARVGLLGAGNGVAARAALSHPIESLEVLVPEQTAVLAAAEFRVAEQPPLGDPRARVRAGSLRDLIARAAPYDVVLDHAAGNWRDVSAETSTREFLELVRDRLAPDGYYCRWVAGSSLTKEGFQILLATTAAVFPQVEIWAGQSADVLILAGLERRPHDFETLLKAYRNPRIAADLKATWIEDPVTLLAQFLASDDTVRRISAGRPVHTVSDPQLTHREVSRRLSEFTVNPVPGLAEIRADVLEAFTRLPEQGFAAAVQRAVRARDVERAGLDAEVAANGRSEPMLQAIRLYEQALELNPRDGSVRRALASARSVLGIGYSQNGAFTAAYASMLTAVETDTTFAEGFANLGNLLLSNEDLDYARVVTQQAIDLAPDDDMLYHQMARIWKRRKYFDRALPYYLEAIRINPRNIDAALGYSDTKLAMETVPDLEGQLEFLRSLVPIEPDNEYLAYRIDKVLEVMELENIADREDAPEEEAPMLLREDDPEEGAEEGADTAPEAPSPEDGHGDF